MASAFAHGLLLTSHGHTSVSIVAASLPAPALPDLPCACGLMAAPIWTETELEAALGPEVLAMTDGELRSKLRDIQNETFQLEQEAKRVQSNINKKKKDIDDNLRKIEMNKVLPYLVGNIVEVIETPEDPDEAEDGAFQDRDAARKDRSAVVKTSTRQTIFLPIIGLVDGSKLQPGDLVGVNKDSYLVLDMLPTEYDSRVKAMEVEEKPKENYSDVGGLDSQIQELVEAIVMPITKKDLFDSLGIKPPKGVLMFGPPGVGKTLMARACAAQSNACFLKLAGPSLVQMFIGDGAKIIRDAFALAREKQPSIIFIDELDAIGTKRFDSDQNGDREVQRTMLELLNQLDGFTSDTTVKIIAATNRVDVLDPALLRSGRIDRKIEFPLPNEDSRSKIMQIHARKMTVDGAVNFEEIARSTEDFNGAQLKAVCVEAGMLAMRRDATTVNHEDFVEGVAQVQAKKKGNLQYYL